jgi:hypothetical protein
MKNSLIYTLVGTLGAVVLLAIVWIYVPRPTVTPDCSFSGWQRTVGVELSTQVDQLKAVKSTLGLSDSQVANYDNLMKDFALKYDAACSDAKATRISREEYACLRRNMDQTLDEVRRFNEMVKSVDSLKDQTATKEAVNRILEDFGAASKSSFRAGCASAFGADPKTLRFLGLVPERSLQVVNRGNNPFTFAVEDYPRGFEPKPSAGQLQPGAAATVALFRTIDPLPSTRPLTFYIRTSFNDAVRIEIEVDAQNAALWTGLAQQLASSGQISVDHALRIVDASTEPASIAANGDRYAIASAVLATAGAKPEAREAIAQSIRLQTDLPQSIAQVTATLGIP